MYRNAENNIKDLFRTHSQKVKVFLKQSETIGSSYDPFRQVGKTIVQQNPRFIKAIVRDVSPEKLLAKTLGLETTGAKELIVHEQDVNTIRICERIVIDGVDYVQYHKAFGNNLTIFKRKFDFYRVIIFRKSDQP